MPTLSRENVFLLVPTDYSRFMTVRKQSQFSFKREHNIKPAYCYAKF